MSSEQAYKAYLHKQKARVKCKNFKRLKFTDRILRYSRSKPNPRTGGYFVSHSGNSKNIGKRFDSPIDVDSFFKIKLHPGDNVYFKRGEIYDLGDYTVSVNNITFGSYGSGAEPSFRGTDDLGSATWTSEGSNVYSTPYSNPVKWIFANGIAAKLAETPWYVITSQPDATHLRATTLISAWASSVSGAQVIVKDHYFSYSFLLNVTAYDNGTGEITISSGVPTGLTGFSFKLFNQQQFLTEAGEWYYDSTADKIYYRTSGSSPSGTDIRVCTKDVCINLADGVSGFTVNGLEFSEYFEAALKGKDNNDCTITECNINNIRTDGIFIYGDSTGWDINNNTISKCGLNGIYTGAISDFFITSNTFTTMGRELTIPFPSFRGTSVFQYEQIVASAIAQTWDETTVQKVAMNGTYELNDISDCGYVGILFLGSDHLVARNRVQDCMKNFWDGAGIYTINHPESPYGGQGDSCTLEDNIVFNIVGNSENTPASAVFTNTYGIYIDINCSLFTIDSNTVYTCTSGSCNMNYGCHDNTITNNLFVGGATGLHFVNFTAPPVSLGENDGNIATGNTLVSDGTGRYCMTFEDLDGDASYNAFSNGGSSDNNSFINPYGTTINARLTGADTTYTLATWQAAYSVDALSTSTNSWITYTSLADSAEEVLVASNWSASSGSVNIGAGYSGYREADGTVVTSSTQSIPAYGGFLYFSISGSKNVRFINVNVGAFSTALNASVSTGYPSALLTNDLLILHTFTPSGSCTVATPAGWTLLHNDTAGAATNNFYYKISTGSESGSFNVAFTGANLIPKLTRIYHFRYNATASFTEDSKTTISSGTTLTGPTLTGTQTRELAVSFISFYNNTPAIGAYTGGSQLWFELGTDYAPAAGTALECNITELRTVSSVNGGTMTTGAAGATTRSFVIKNAINVP